MACTVKFIIRSIPQMVKHPALKDNCCFSNYYFISPKQNNTLLHNFIATASFNNTIAIVKYRPLERHQKYTLDQSQNSNYLNVFNGLPKSFFGKSGNKKNKKKRVPKLVLLQNPFKWFMVKFDFTVLRRIWDPEFAEKDFKFGTKQAISRVTHLISDGQYMNLNGLLTKPAKVSLIRELDRNYSDRQRALLALDKEDIQITAPRKVYFIKIADRKYCDVDMAFLALKWVPIQSIEALVLTEIFARFHREYTPNCIPEWTIAYFKITRFQILRRVPLETR